MKRFIKDYFTFNKRERNGVFILLVIIFIQIIWLSISSRFVKLEEEDDPQLKKMIAEFMSSQKETPEASSETSFEEGVENTAIPERFDFDPNTVTDEDWERLGLSHGQVRSIRKFLNKGGRFRRKEDLKKMYKLSAGDYQGLEPYIRIRPETKSEALPVPESTKLSHSKTEVMVELNSADSAQLTQLKGIGAWFAKAIIRYRTSVGGFYKKEQLMEVWKFDAEKYSSVEKNIIVDPSAIRKVNINMCTAAELKSPYLSWNAVNGIINYRKQHGPFKTLRDIRATDLVDEETYSKIVPYLVTE